MVTVIDYRGTRRFRRAILAVKYDEKFSGSLLIQPLESFFILLQFFMNSILQKPANLER